MLKGVADLERLSHKQVAAEATIIQANPVKLTKLPTYAPRISFRNQPIRCTPPAPVYDPFKRASDQPSVLLDCRNGKFASKNS